MHGQPPHWHEAAGSVGSPPSASLTPGPSRVPHSQGHQLLLHDTHILEAGCSKVDETGRAPAWPWRCHAILLGPNQPFESSPSLWVPAFPGFPHFASTFSLQLPALLTSGPAPEPEATALRSVHCTGSHNCNKVRSLKVSSL